MFDPAAALLHEATISDIHQSIRSSIRLDVRRGAERSHGGRQSPDRRTEGRDAALNPRQALDDGTENPQARSPAEVKSLTDERLSVIKVRLLHPPTQTFLVEETCARTPLKSSSFLASWLINGSRQQVARTRSVFLAREEDFSSSASS